VTATGSEATRMVVLRGNSGSGKSTTARALRDRIGRGVAWVEQDHLRRVVLRDYDVPDGASIGLIDQTVRYALDHGYDVILEGILHTAYYEPMLRRLTADHRGNSGHYYFDIPFDETVRRHATRPLAQAFSADDMRTWYRTRDLLDFVEERVIDHTSSLDGTITRIIADLDWTAGDPG